MLPANNLCLSEAEWLECPDPKPLLLGLENSGVRAERKLRLFAIACVRRYWHLLAENSKGSIEVAERFVEGQASLAELTNAHRLALTDSGSWWECAGAAVSWSESTIGTYEALEASQASDFVCTALEEDDVMSEVYAQLELLHDIFGNPFRQEPCIEHSWLTWSDGAIAKLAQEIYNQKSFERMTVLADTLEEAGCKDKDILDHCRNGKSHVRGCWVVDLLLGKD